MPSTPLICSSIGAATVSAITFGLAPGYCARTTTDGGTTSGYSEIGIWRSAKRPATKISTDSTPAKIGRSMKNLEIFMSRPRRRCRVPRFALSACGDVARRRRLRLIGASHGDELRRKQRAWAHTLQSVHYDSLAGSETIRHPAQAVDEDAECHLAVGGLVVGADHHDVFLVLVGADRAFVDHQGRLSLRLAHAQARELTRNETAFGIAEHRPHPHCSALGINLVVDKLHMAFEGRAIAGGGDHLHRNAVDLHMGVGS